ncbi:MAG TPA: zinc-binding dehydrogenase, partial [Polyangia bacterium]|jgi:NADPH:quinone reductase-like Zn-dependent oxidoreductase|nr:zinc-binding dehydrogenase [Polyangia bacterium]
LVHAAGSGVGTAAVQVARTIGARVLGTARTQEKLQRALALGLDEGVRVADGGAFAPAILQATGQRGADVVLDLVGGRYLAEDLACVARRGRIVLVGLLAGARADLDLRLLLNKRARILGTVLRSRPLEEKIEAAQQLARHLVPLFERGALAPVVHQVLPLAQAADAHELVASGTTYGKVVLAI